MENVGNAGGPYDVAKHNRLRLFDALKGFAHLHLSLEQMAGAAFGQGSSTHVRVQKQARKAEDQRQARLHHKRVDFQEFIGRAFKGGAIRRAARLMELQERVDTGLKGPAAHMSQLQGVYKTLEARNPDTAAWLAAHGWTAEILEAVEKWLEPEAKALREYAARQWEDQYDEINAVYAPMKGVNLPGVQNYAPRMVEHGGKDADMAIGEQNVAGMMSGFTRRRFDMPKGPPKMGDLLQVYWANQNVVSHWLAWAPVVSEWRATITSRDVRLAVETHKGKPVGSKMMKWVRDVETNGVVEAIASTEVGHFITRWFDARAKTALFGRLTVLAAQTPAAIASAAKVPTGQWLRSAARVDSGNAALSWSEMFNSDMIQTRLDQGGPLMRAAAKAEKNRPGILLRPFAQYGRSISSAIDLGTAGVGSTIGFTDAGFTVHSALVAWDATYLQAKETMSEEDARAQAWERAAIIVGQTAQPMTIIDKSLMEVEWPVMGKLIFAFQSAPRQAWSLLYEGLANAGKDKPGAARTTAMFVVLVPTLTFIMKGLARYVTSDDDWEDEWSWKQWGAQIAAAPAQGLIVAGPAVEHIATAEARMTDAPVGTDLAKALSSLNKLTKDGSDFNSKDAGNLAQSVSTALGGRAAAIGVANNILQQFLGLAAAVSEGDQDRESFRASKNRKDEKKASKE